MANLINEAKRMQFLAGLITESQLNERTNWSYYLEDAITKDLEGEEVRKRIKDVEILDKPFEELRKFIVNTDLVKGGIDFFNDGLKKRINDILTLAKGKGVSEEIVKNEIAMQLYTEFFNRGSGSFVRLYFGEKTRPTLFNVKKTLEDIGGFDKTGTKILNSIESWLNKNK
jgi:hypothetical protein